MRISKSFSFDDEKDLDILNYLSNLANQSEYIKKLIRIDMEKSSTKKKLLQIKKLLDDILEENDITIKKDQKLDKKDIKEIKNILKL